VGGADDADLAAGAAPAEVAVIDHSTATAEALATPEQCRDLARETGARKFRVEGTPVGNSRLLCLPTAKRVQTKLGGKIVNYRPRPELPPLERAAKEAGLPPCPLCGAAPGTACRTVGWRGARRRPHAIRLAPPAPEVTL
jgi:hypothetical protein